MSVLGRRSPPGAVGLAAVDDGMSATITMCVALVVALIVYVLGVTVLQQDVAGGAPWRASAAEMSFHGP
ncbi:MAG TPA: hypothetical protein VF886_13860 [Roseiarcus sp.]